MAKEKTEEKVNTTETLAKGKSASLVELDKQVAKAAKVLGASKKVEVFIPKYLVNRLGANYPVAINGAVIHVPVGEKVKIPEPMALVLNESLGNLKL